MASPKGRPRLTVDEYLEMERASEVRHVYLDGQIYAMAGESWEHGDITVNLVTTVANQLKGTPCRARIKDTKVRSGPIPMSGQSVSGMFSYPDILVLCGEPEYHDAFTDIILNPTAIMEVLSPGTEAFDRGEKFKRYQTWNPTLRDYLLVSQDQPQVEHFHRLDDGSWAYQLYAGLDAKISIPSIQCTLNLADVYDRVTFVEK